MKTGVKYQYNVNNYKSIIFRKVNNMNTLVIKKEDIRYNIKQIKELVEKAGKDDNGNFIKIIAVLKNNGYGLGLVQYSKFLIDNGIDFLAVSTVEEAIKLREAKIE